MIAVILAAGAGSRLGALAGGRPKPMVEIGGRPILEHNIVALRAAGIAEVVINLHHLPDVITGHFGDGSQLGVQIHWSHEPSLLGTAGALRPVAELLTETFLVVYGDNHFDGDVGAVLEAHEQIRPCATIALLHRDDVRPSGEVLHDAGGRVERIIEKGPGPRPRPGWVNAGLVVLEPMVLEHVPVGRPSDLAGEVLPTVIADGGDVRAVPFRGRVTWIDTPEDLEAARARLGPGQIE